WPTAILVCARAALVIGALSVRTSGVHFIMITLAFAEMIYFLFQSLKACGGSDGLGFRRRDALPFLDMRDDVTFYYVCLGLMVVFVALCRRIVRSRFGMALQGIRQNERRMAALGLHTGGYKLAAFVIAGAGAGLAGALSANLLRFVSPDMMHWTISGDLLAMVILGGVGSVFGPVLGAAVMVAVQSWLAQWTEHWMILFGPFLVLVVLFARGGIWGLLSGSGRPAQVAPLALKSAQP
ncbi:MAG: branched-chain amino acid ABC transporter permease, partial [Acetobacteraceae bacterium]